MSKEVMKLALDALKSASVLDAPTTAAEWDVYQGHIDSAISDLTAALVLPDAQPVATKAALEAAHKWGFLRAAGWMQRDDLFADVDSPTYLKDRDHDLAQLAPKPVIHAKQAKP